MTDLNLTHLRSVAGAATPGPWHESPHDGAVDNADWDCITDDVYYARDRRHIATFDPPTVLALIDRIEELERVGLEYAEKKTRKIHELYATIQRVRDLHSPDAVFTDTCSECSDYGTDEHPAGRMVEHPCPTIQTLGDPT